MATLRVIIDDILAEPDSRPSHYARDLTRSLIDTTPTGCSVEGVVAGRSEAEVADLLRQLPRLDGVHTVALGRRELSVAWQMGAKHPSLGGMVHSPSLFAPLRKHERHGSHQVVVSLHSTAEWDEASAHTSADALWRKRILKRVRQHADAVVVPSHATGRSLARLVPLGDRVRVIPPAVSAELAVPADPEERADRLGLPRHYAVAVGGAQRREALPAFFRAVATPLLDGITALVIAPPEDAVRIHEQAMQAGLAEQRVQVLSALPYPDFALTLHRARVLVAPAVSSGFGMPILEAFTLGTPVVQSDAPALMETAGGASLAVDRDDQGGYPNRLADAIAAVLGDDALAARLRVLGEDRARAYSWQSTAAQVWQLHADL